MGIVKGAQIRAARALIGWSRQDLANASGLHANAVGYWEIEDEIPNGTCAEPVACRRIREALLEAGVEFHATPAPGVRFSVNSTIKPDQRARARPSWSITSAEILPDISPTKTHAVGQSAPSAPKRCGAKTRSGHPCRRKGVAPGKRCPNHGGLSTGPRTTAGRQRIARAQRKRWANYRRGN